MNAHVREHDIDQQRPPLRRMPRERASIHSRLLAGTAIVSSTLLGFALVDLFEPQTLADWCKVGVMTMGAGLSSIGVNRLAVRTATSLTVKGYPLAGAGALATVAFLGGSFAVVTYAGLTRPDVEALRLEDHGAVLSRIAGDNARSVSPAAQAVPIVRGVASDLSTKAACEKKESCLSGRASGGRGPVSRAVEALAERGATVAAQLEGMTRGGEGQAALAVPLLARYQTILSEAGSARLKRPALQKIDAEVRAAMAGRAIADPSALVAAYAAELERPFVIAGQPEASRIVTAHLQSHAAALKRALAMPSPKEAALPLFPKPAGVSDTLAYAGHFWPVAAIAIVIDLLFPLLLLLCVLCAKRWGLYQRDPSDIPPPERDEFGLGEVRPRLDVRPADDPDGYFPGLSPRARPLLDHDQGGWR